MASDAALRSRAAWQFAAYELPFLGVVLALCWLTIISLMHPKLLTIAHSPTLAAFMVAASLLIAAAAAYVAISEFLLYGILASLCIGLAFIVFATADIGIRLIPLFLGSDHPLRWTALGSAIEDTAAGSLLVLAGLTVSRVMPIARRTRTLLTSGSLALASVFLLTISVFRAGSKPLPQGVTEGIAILAAALLFAASALFWSASKKHSRAWFFWLALSVSLAGFASLQYGIHQYPVTIVQPGDVIRLVFFTGILLALASGLSQNYRGLRWQARELRALNALSGAREVYNLSTALAQIERVAGEALQATSKVLLAERERTSLGRSAWGPNGRPAEQGGVTWRAFVAPHDGRTGNVLIGVPLRTSERYLGTLIATRSSGEEFSVYDLRLLKAYGAQASLLLERTILYEETAASAVLQERSRLAREIHDGLAQHLAFLKMRVAWLRRAPNAISEEQLRDIEGVLETALIEARHAITTLRSQLAGASPVEALTRYAEEFGQVSGLAVHVTADVHLPETSPKAQVELLRIVQEALNNVRKHAHASEVEIELRSHEGGMETRVSDNGSGFAEASSPQGHFGLEIMRERAESVGGNLSIASKVGAGTAIRIWLPNREQGHEEAPADTLDLAKG